MMMLNIVSENCQGFLIHLSSIDISVPLIEKGRTTEDCERWSICRLLSTLTKYGALEFPVEVIKRERPDFCLYMGKRQIGVEFTEAIQPDYERTRVLPEASSHGSTIDPSLFKWGGKKKTLGELRSMASETKYTGPGWDGDEMEGEWSLAMSDIVRRKTSRLNSKGFETFPEDWLLIYDNLSLIYDIDSDSFNLSCSLLINALEEYWSVDSFDKIFIEIGSCIIELEKENFAKLKLNDIWKRR